MSQYTTRRLDYRLTCFFVDRNHRREGIAAIALGGALDLIATAGGGVVEGDPQDAWLTLRAAGGHCRGRPGKRRRPR